MYLIYQQVCIPAPKTPATTKSITYFDRGMFSSGLYLFPTLRTDTQVPEAMDPSDTRILSHPEKPDHAGKGVIWPPLPPGREGEEQV